MSGRSEQPLSPEQRKNRAAFLKRMYGANETRTMLVNAEGALLAAETRAQELRLRTPGRWCDVCFTSSWSPCPEGMPDAVRDPDEAGFMVCHYCQLFKAFKGEREAREAAEHALAWVTENYPKAMREMPGPLFHGLRKAAAGSPEGTRE